MRSCLLLLSTLIAAPAFAQTVVGTASVAPAAGPGAPRIAPPSASDLPAMPPPAPPGPPQAPATGDAADGLDPAWRAYHAAFLEAVIGEADKARVELELVRARHPDHVVARLADDLLQRLYAARRRVADEERFGTREATGLARAELVSFQTISGIAGAGFLCGVAECDDGRLIVGALTLGATAGLTTSLLLTQDGISPGRALAINTGTMWGVWNGGAIAVAAQANDRGPFAALLLGQLVGLGSGVLVGHLTDPTAGDVSLATSGGLWLGGITFMVFGLADFPASFEATLLTSALVSDLGLFGGALLSGLDIAPMSRARVLIIDSGGVLGTLIGMGLSVLIKGEVDSAPAFFGPAIAGALVGLGSATYLSRGWDAPDLPPVSAAVTPLRDGAALTIGGAF